MLKFSLEIYFWPDFYQEKTPDIFYASREDSNLFSPKYNNYNFVNLRKHPIFSVTQQQNVAQIQNATSNIM